MVAGAIVSGSYFGDKMSPLSDTTNLAAGVTGTDLFTHIRHMLYTTVPSLLLALVLYGLLGWRFAEDNGDGTQIDNIMSALKGRFTIGPVLLLPPVLVIVMVVLRVPPLPAILAGAGLGGLFAMLMQNAGPSMVFEVAYSGYASETGIVAVDSLLSRGGLIPMMDTVALIMCALAFGGILERTGMLSALTQALLGRVRSTGSLVLTTNLSALGINAMTADQYLSIIVPGRMFARAFEERNLDSRNLSRCLEDTGTLTSPLIPWNSCGAFVAAALGVSPWVYAPYAFLNLINPLLSVVYGYTGITMMKRKEGESKANGGRLPSGEKVEKQ
jgi:NhaC family Na+:H+ antiporter